MKRYELTIRILNRDYIDSLVTSLVRQGYSVYLNQNDNEVNTLHFEVSDEDLIEIKSN